MKKKTLLFVFTFTLLFSFAAFAQLDRSIVPPPGPAPKILIADYKMFELPNGLKVIVVENNKQPVVSFSLQIDRDPVLEGQNAGYVSIAGSLLRTGTAARTKDKLDNDIDFIGGAFYTSATSIYASSLKKHVDALLDIMSDVVLNANFTQPEFDKLVKQEKSSLAAQKEEPGSIAGIVLKKILYGKEHPYSESMTETTLNNVTLDMCKEYYKTYFKPNYAYLAIVGNINEAEAKALAEKYFGKWEKGEKKSFTYQNPTAPLITKVSIVDRDNSVQSTIRVGYVLDLKPGSEDDIKARVTNTVLGGGAFRLFENLREKHAYTYGAYSSLGSDKLIGRFTANTEARNEVTDSSIAQILYEMKRIRNEAVPDLELQKAKNYLTGSFAISLESPQTVANFAINTDKYHLPKDYYANYLQKVAEVTAEDVQKTAQKYILPDQANILVVGKASDIADKLKKFTIGKIDYYDIHGEKYDPAAQKAPEGVTAKTVIDKYLAAIGGVEKLKTTVDKKTTMTAALQEITINITLLQKAPNKFAQTLAFAGMEQKISFNGEKGFQTAQGQKTELTGDALESLKFESAFDLMYNLDKYGIKANLTGIEKINGKDSYRIELTLPSGKKWLHYYDTETGFKTKESKTLSTPKGEFAQTIEFSDYKEVDGIKYPFKYIQNIGPQTIDLTVSSVEVNKGVDDDIFETK